MRLVTRTAASLPWPTAVNRLTPGQTARPTTVHTPSGRRCEPALSVSTEGCSCASACRLSPIAIAAVAAYLPLRAAVTPSSVPPAFVGAGVVALGAASEPPGRQGRRPHGPARTSKQPGHLRRTSPTAPTTPSAPPAASERGAATTKLSAEEAAGRGLAAPARRLRPSPRRTASASGKLHAGIDLAAAGGHAVQGDPRRRGDRGRLQRRLRLRDHHQARRRHRDHLRALAPPAGPGRRRR